MECAACLGDLFLIGFLIPRDVALSESFVHERLRVGREMIHGERFLCGVRCAVLDITNFSSLSWLSTSSVSSSGVDIGGFIVPSWAIWWLVVTNGVIYVPMRMIAR
jgi:hypothetical protein